tara:strand:- start:604 stop:822 length:219 start_codon:yes stop_codon:yes gene_type:complete
MDELLDLIATDQSPSEVTDKIKDVLYSKASERIQSQKPDIAMQMFDPTSAEIDQDVSDETVDSVDDSTEDED